MSNARIATPRREPKIALNLLRTVVLLASSSCVNAPHKTLEAGHLMQHKVTTFLMFEGTAEEAMSFYMSLFDDSQIVAMEKYGANDAGPEGTVRQARFELAGREFMCIDSPAKHDFTFTPSMSLYIECESESEIDQRFASLSEGGEVFMPLGDYGFSRKFGWVSDRYGVSWQLTLPNE